MAAACIGPAPPNGISANPRGSTPRSTVTTRSARDISALATRTMPSAASSRERPSCLREAGHGALRGLDVEGDTAGEGALGAQVAEQQVGVGDRRLGPAAAVTRGSRRRARRLRPHAQSAPAVAPAD